MPRVDNALIELAAAMLDTAIPGDENGPSATAAGGLDFLGLALEDERFGRRVQDGLEHLAIEAASRHRGKPVCNWTESERFAFLSDLEQGRTATGLDGASEFPATVIAFLANKGYYSDPANLGNRGGRLTAAGLIKSWGIAGKNGMRDLYRRSLVVVGPVQEIPAAASRVTLHPRLRDRLGVPVAVLSGRPHRRDAQAAELLVDRASAWLSASGAVRVEGVLRAPQSGPRAGTHQAGTCRMGDEPETSVTDAWGRVWGHPNVVIADGSVHVTNGGVNPVLTIMANAYRMCEHLAGHGP